MKTINFPYIAFGLCSFLLLLVMKGSETGNDGQTILPLLTLLVVSEFSFFVTAIGGYIGIKHSLVTSTKPIYMVITLLCILLSLRFMLLGIALWPL